jgi:predicted porin
MKKSLLALAALSAFASFAHAQSSVTLYGIIDEAAVYESSQKTGGANTVASPNVGGKKIALDSGSGLNGSRWGLKGVEDLGGGLKAVFQLENGLNLNTGGFNQGGLEFGRQAYVGLSSEAFGTVTAGRQYDALVDFIGPMIFADQIGSAYSALPGDVDNANNGQRINNEIKYTSPNFNGLHFEGAYSLGGVAGEITRNSVYTGAIGYANGPFALAAAILHVNQPNVSYFSNSAIGASTIGTAASSVTTTSNPMYGGYVNANSFQSVAAGGTYALGPANFGLIYSNVKFSNLDSGLSAISAAAGVPAGNGVGTAVFNSLEANFTWHWTPALQTGGAYSYTKGSSVQFSGLTSNGTHNTGGTHYSQFSLSTDYALSKRTDVYILGVYQLASGIDSTGTSATAAINTLSGSTNNHEGVVRIGLRHKF